MDTESMKVLQDYRDGKLMALGPIKCPHCLGAAINTGETTMNEKWGEVVYFKCNNPNCERFEKEFNIEVKTATMYWGRSKGGGF